MEIGIIIFVLYFIPSINAYWKKKRNKSAVLTLNFFLGWTVIGWIVALIWSSTKDPAPTVVIQKHESKNSTNDLVELHKLKEKGVLTQEEFDSQKKKILG